MATLCQTGWGVVCQHTETWIHSLDNFTDFLMFSQTTSPNSDSTGVLLSGAFVCFICHTNRTFLCPTYLFIGCLSPGARQHKHDLEEGRSISFKNLFSTPLSFSSPKIGHKQEKKDRPTSRNQCSQQQFGEVEHWRLIQTCCWHQEQKGNALMASFRSAFQECKPSYQFPNFPKTGREISLLKEYFANF